MECLEKSENPCATFGHILFPLSRFIIIVVVVLSLEPNLVIKMGCIFSKSSNHHQDNFQVIIPSHTIDHVLELTPQKNDDNDDDSLIIHTNVKTDDALERCSNFHTVEEYDELLERISNHNDAELSAVPVPVPETIDIDAELATIPIPVPVPETTDIDVELAAVPIPETTDNDAELAAVSVPKTRDSTYENDSNGVTRDQKKEDTEFQTVASLRQWLNAPDGGGEDTDGDADYMAQKVGFSFYENNSNSNSNNNSRGSEENSVMFKTGKQEEEETIVELVAAFDKYMLQLQIDEDNILKQIHNIIK